jgi:hypothetical protein
MQARLVFIHVIFVIVDWLAFDFPVRDVDERVRIVHARYELFSFTIEVV